MSAALSRGKRDPSRFAVHGRAALSVDSGPVPFVVTQHVEEAAHLRRVRSTLVRGAHVRLSHLGRLDERLAAHLDGVRVAGSYGAGLALQALERPGVGEVFVAAVGAIEDRDAERLNRLLSIAEALPDCCAGLLSAFGWVSGEALQGVTKPLLESKASPWRRQAGLLACAMHAVNPGASLASAMRDPDSALRSSALRVAGRCARFDLVEDCLAARVDADPRCAFEAARSALLLGDRTASQATLEALAIDRTSPFAIAALELVLKVTPTQRARAMLSALADDPAHARTLIRGIAIAGDPRDVPWLIAQMDDPRLGRVAGEAFSLVTGLDLADLDLDRRPPDRREMGPNDDPLDENVSAEEDESLLWPSQPKIAEWWHAHGARFTPGTRFFMGKPPTPGHCFDVLNTGFQSQRIAAAEYLTLLSGAIPLFNTASPSKRQQRLLAQMVAR